nr:lysine-specific histone demethylase 1 homolog 3-like [Tanacetum cinerariifolium]
MDEQSKRQLYQLQMVWESAGVDSNIFTKAWVDSVGSEGLKDHSAIDRWQSQATAADSDFFNRLHVMDEEDSNINLKQSIRRHDGLANESSALYVNVNREMVHSQPGGVDNIKQSVVDYVPSLLMPLYKARKIDKESYKQIMKKTATKVMKMQRKRSSYLSFLILSVKTRVKFECLNCKLPLILFHAKDNEIGKPLTESVSAIVKDNSSEAGQASTSDNNPSTSIIDAQRCISLYFALCTKKHSLFRQLLIVYKNMSKAAKSDGDDIILVDFIMEIMSRLVSKQSLPQSQSLSLSHNQSLSLSHNRSQSQLQSQPQLQSRSQAQSQSQSQAQSLSQSQAQSQTFSQAQSQTGDTGNSEKEVAAEGAKESAEHVPNTET